MNNITCILDALCVILGLINATYWGHNHQNALTFVLWCLFTLICGAKLAFDINHRN